MVPELPALSATAADPKGDVMRSTILLVLLTLAGTPVPADDGAKSSQPDVAGLYACEGMSPEGRPYKGTVEIVRLDDTYRIRWSFEGREGVLQVVGVGIFTDGVLAVSYFGGAPGIAVYKPDGPKLVGQWTIGGADGVIYPETLTRQSDQRREPSAPRQTPPPSPSRRPASIRPAVAALR
jgi:hypothetical protein